MKKGKQGFISIKKVIGISLIAIILLGISVVAGNVKLNNVKIRFSNNHEITVLTSKTKVSEILEENHIMLSSDEQVTPCMDEEITNSNLIIISLQGNEPAKVSTVLENTDDNIDVLTKTYENITEGIITEREEIPYETITKDVSNGSGNTSNKVIQAGKNGIKEVTYKVRYKDDVEFERIEISSKIIKEPVNKIVQVQTTTSRSYTRTSGVTTATSGRYKVTAYCSCAKCCGKTNGITASGARATANHTIAAPGTFAFGTQLKINGQIYTVEDRGGAIQGNRIDIYMDSHAQAIAWGVRYLDVEVLN